MRMTSAPPHPNILAQTGATARQPKSRTLIPSNGNFALNCSSFDLHQYLPLGWGQMTPVPCNPEISSPLISSMSLYTSSLCSPTRGARRLRHQGLSGIR